VSPPPCRPAWRDLTRAPAPCWRRPTPSPRWPARRPAWRRADPGRLGMAADPTTRHGRRRPAAAQHLPETH
jgi:hypothetical protein